MYVSSNQPVLTVKFKGMNHENEALLSASAWWVTYNVCDNTYIHTLLLWALEGVKVKSVNPTNDIILHRYTTNYPNFI